ncbi:MAG TPA: dienelactone hydrolase family protein [Kiritimatiellia bacterium]|nr:dienelactone hydrolase family protein [Kiritimatiellia bacterium]HMO99388.1 dienelactone hydrolase family protein [Kiritimatiellia bacterium]HMP96510.1 dienelactone hydrolase family protein [Kiritimatiellia bacterium]
MNKLFSLIAGIACLTATAFAESLQPEIIVYSEGETTLEGAFFHDGLENTTQPGIIIFHQWGGPGEYEQTRADMLAALGYAVLVADVYGQGVRPAEVADRAATAGSFRADRPLTRARAQAALETIRSRPEVDGGRIAAIGYCFGGMVALELARSGADIKAAVSIHGSLNTPNPEDAAAIQAAVLVQHGAIDPYVPDQEVEAFKQAMDDAGATYTFIAYENAVHSFTDWFAGNDPSTGAAYDVDADKKSWEDLLAFLTSTLGE